MLSILFVLCVFPYVWLCLAFTLPFGSLLAFFFSFYLYHKLFLFQLLRNHLKTVQLTNLKDIQRCHKTLSIRQTSVVFARVGTYIAKNLENRIECEKVKYWKFLPSTLEAQTKLQSFFYFQKKEEEATRQLKGYKPIIFEILTLTKTTTCLCANVPPHNNQNG